MYSFNYRNYDGRRVIEVFTSLEEYNQIYADSDEYVPLNWYFNQFQFDEDTMGILINPSSDNFFIPDNLCFLIMDDMDDIKSAIRLNNRDADPYNLRKAELRSNRVSRYLESKTKITYVKKLFGILSYSPTYVLYESKELLDGHFKNGMISISDINLHYHKKDGYIMVFTDKGDFKGEKDSKTHFCYGICNMICVIRTIFELDYKGFILKANGREFPLDRHRLLKYWDDIAQNYHPVENASKYAFEIGDDEYEGL